MQIEDSAHSLLSLAGATAFRSKTPQTTSTTAASFSIPPPPPPPPFPPATFISPMALPVTQPMSLISQDSKSFSNPNFSNPAFSNPGFLSAPAPLSASDDRRALNGKRSGSDDSHDSEEHADDAPDPKPRAKRSKAATPSHEDAILTRRRKHNEVEVRRRKRMNETFAQLKVLAECKSSNKIAILTAAIQKLEYFMSLQNSGKIDAYKPNGEEPEYIAVKPPRKSSSSTNLSPQLVGSTRPVMPIAVKPLNLADGEMHKQQQQQHQQQQQQHSQQQQPQPALPLAAQMIPAFPWARPPPSLVSRGLMHPYLNIPLQDAEAFQQAHAMFTHPAYSAALAFSDHHRSLMGAPVVSARLPPQFRRLDDRVLSADVLNAVPANLPIAAAIPLPLPSTSIAAPSAVKLESTLDNPPMLSPGTPVAPATSSSSSVSSCSSSLASISSSLSSTESSAFSPTLSASCPSPASQSSSGTSCVCAIDVSTSVPSSNQCVLCFSRPLNVVQLPCGHMKYCSICVSSLGASLKGCAECRAPTSKMLYLQDRDSKGTIDFTGARCLLCEDSPRDVALNPCGHFLYCTSCTKRVKKCPQCLTPVESRVFIHVNSP